MALIQCLNCGHMISDKAIKCPKCGCPVIKDYINYQQPVEEPAYYESENHTRKWLYAVIGVLIVAIAGFGFLWYSQSKGNKEIREFVMQFSKAVESGDSVTIRNLYPDAADADSLYIPNSEFMITKNDKSNNFKVEWNNDVWVELTSQEKGKWIIGSSQGLFAWPENMMEFAKKTGQWKAGLTDKELSTRMNDKEFKNKLIDEFCNNFKKKVIQKGSLEVLKESQFELDPWTLGITIANSNDVQISGNDYKVTMRVWNQYIYNGNMDENEAWSSAFVQGKDITPMGETVLSRSFEGMFEWVKDNTVKIQWNINNQQLFDKYFVAKGNEYENYSNSNN